MALLRRGSSPLALSAFAAATLFLGSAPAVSAAPASVSGTVVAAGRPVVGSTVELYAAGRARAARLAHG